MECTSNGTTLANVVNGFTGNTADRAVSKSSSHVWEKGQSEERLSILLKGNLPNRNNNNKKALG